MSDAEMIELMIEVQRRLDAFHSPSFDREIVEKLMQIIKHLADKATDQVACLAKERDEANTFGAHMDEAAAQWRARAEAAEKERDDALARAAAAMNSKPEA